MKYKYWIYRDKDRQVADDDEDGGTSFYAEVNAKPIDVDGEAAAQNYKAKFSNILDGSVKVKKNYYRSLAYLRREITKAVLGFSVDGIGKKSKTIVMDCSEDSSSEYRGCAQR